MTMTALTPPAEARPSTDAESFIRIGLLSFALLVGVLGAWAFAARIQGAVILRGEAVVAGRPKQVQSADGGIVKAIAVKNGDVVAAGDLLVAFDDTLPLTNLDTARNRLADALALRARLLAESRDLAVPDFDAMTSPVDLPFPASDIAERRNSQLRLFEIRAQSRRDRAAQLTQELDQLRARIAGTEAQITAADAQRRSIEAELATMATLGERGLLRQREVTAMERQHAEVLGRIATLRAEIDGYGTQMRQREIEARQADFAFREKVDTDLREVTARIQELTLEIRTLEDRLSRIELRAPVGGKVHELQLATLGGVVAPGDTVVQIVPQNRGVEFELRLDPGSVDAVHPGQAARIAIPALGPGDASQIPAVVRDVAPDAVTDSRSGSRFYRVTLEVAPEDLEPFGERAVVPGMPVEAFLETGARSVLSYLVEPVQSHLRRAMREQ